MRVLAIDPGPVESACVLLSDECEVTADGRTPWPVLESSDEPNDILALLLPDDMHRLMPDATVIEDFVAQGQRIAQPSIDTIKAVGILAHLANAELLNRREVKIHLCGKAAVKEADVNAVLWDRYGGTRKEAVGTKAKPGPLYGVTKHRLAALAVGVTWLDKRQEESD